jgi:GAF domain-containing protein
MTRMDAQESPPVPTGAGPPPEGMTLGRLLALLGEGVSAEDLEMQLAAMEAEKLLDPAAAAAARSLNARLREASRREGLLRVLYDTATDLTGIRDVEAVLKAIVRRTRSLIGSDIAYLSLNDYASGESYIRVTDGAATALFRNIRMPLGEGVLGAVATGEAPSQSADYLSDRTKSHLASSDAAVAAEGVKAIMGVPLRAEGKVIGALLVADRHAHNFSSDDVALMESIGTHAAVALENARHFTEMADALARLDQAQQQNLLTSRRWRSFLPLISG